MDRRGQRRRDRELPVKGGSALWVTAVALVALAAQHCMVVTSSGDYQIGPLAGLSGCSTTAQCGSSFVCLLDLCAHACTSDSDCDPNWACLSDAMGNQACEPHCNPLAAQLPDPAHVGCPSGAACLINGNQVTFCGGGGPGTVAEGQPCTVYTDCAAGLVCSVDGTNTNGVCTKYCRVGQNDCANGAACQGFSPAEMDGTQEIGLCPQ
jgi:hypothetical protein